MRMNGAQILLESLVREGVEHIYGYPGGVVLPLYDRFPEFPKLHHVLVRHEQGAAHAADGYARASGKVGVCLATSGPGATNLVTGICTAMMDSVPMVAITGNVARDLLGRDGFQVVAYEAATAVFMDGDPEVLPGLIASVRADIKAQIARLSSDGVTEFGFFGSSLGSFIFYNCVGDAVPELRWGVFITGGDIAQGMWRLDGARQAHVTGGWSLARLAGTAARSSASQGVHAALGVRMGPRRRQTRACPATARRWAFVARSAGCAGQAAAGYEHSSSREETHAPSERRSDGRKGGKRASPGSGSNNE